MDRHRIEYLRDMKPWQQQPVKIHQWELLELLDLAEKGLVPEPEPGMASVRHQHVPKFKVGDIVRFKSKLQDVPQDPFLVVEVRGNSMSIGPDCWYGQGAFELASSQSWTLPQPPEGLSWHRSDGWTQEMLPDGWRPMVLGERSQDGDEFRNALGNWKDCILSMTGHERCQRSDYHTRSRRPVPTLITRPLTAEEMATAQWLKHPDGHEFAIVTVEKEGGIRAHYCNFSRLEAAALCTERWQWAERRGGEYRPCWKTELEEGP